MPHSKSGRCRTGVCLGRFCFAVIYLLCSDGLCCRTGNGSPGRGSPAGVFQNPLFPAWFLLSARFFRQSSCRRSGERGLRRYPWRAVRHFCGTASVKVLGLCLIGIPSADFASFAARVRGSPGRPVDGISVNGQWSASRDRISLLR